MADDYTWAAPNYYSDNYEVPYDPSYADLGYTQLEDGTILYGDITIRPDGSVSGGGYDFTAEELMQDPTFMQTISQYAPMLSTLGSAALNLYSNNRATDAMTSAYGKGINAQNAALARQMGLTEEQIKNLTPYTGLGLQGVREIEQFSNPNYSFLGSPSFNFVNQETQKMLNRSLASRGLLGGGQAAMAKGDATQRIAANDFETAYNRALNKVKIGQGAVGSANAALGTMSGNYGTNAMNVGNLLGNQGTARAGLYSNLPNNVYDAASLGFGVYDWMKNK